MTNLCTCGRPIPQRFNSTIQMKKCPSCTLNDAKEKAKKSGGGKSSAMRTADMWFSRYIRLKYSFFDLSKKELFCKCYTSGKVYHIKKLDLGHYHSRGIAITRYHENNARPQSKFHNRYKSGCHTAFEANLEAELGVDAIEELRSLTRAYFKADEAFYREMATKYRLKYKEEVKIKGIDPWKSKTKD